MKLTFKQFLEDIVVDDGAYDKDSSDEVVKGASKTGERLKSKKTKWKDVPLKKAFPVKGFTVKYNQQKMERWAGSKTYDIVLVDDKTGDIAVHIDCSARDYQVPGGTIEGLEMEQLSSNAAYRGKGLVVALYACLVENGQNLFSATLQTSGGASVWKRLTQSVDAQVFAVIPSGEVHGFMYDSLSKKSILSDYDYVLGTGSVAAVDKVVYETVEGDSFFFITTYDMSSFKKHMVKV